MTLATAPIFHGSSAYIPGWQEPAGAGNRRETADDEIRHLVDEIISPILNSENISVVFSEKSAAFQARRDEDAALPDQDSAGWEALLRREDAIDRQLQRLFAEASERLGDARADALIGGLRFRKAVRETVLRHADIWPENSLRIIGRRMALNELCLACVLHHLTTGDGRESNVQTLALWSYQFADYASLEVGYACADLGLGRKLEWEQ